LCRSLATGVFGGFLSHPVQASRTKSHQIKANQTKDEGMFWVGDKILPLERLCPEGRMSLYILPVISGRDERRERRESLT